MSTTDPKVSFLRAAREWVCDGYSLDIRYIARPVDEVADVWQALVGFSPLPPKIDNSFEVRATNYVIGQHQQQRGKKAFLHRVLEEGAEGTIPLPKRPMALPKLRQHDYYSEMSLRDRWSSSLHLQVSGSGAPNPNYAELAAMDDELRLATPAFDGLADAARWLGLVAPGATSAPPMIVMRVNPPCEVLLDESKLANDKLTITLVAHSRFDVDQVGLAISPSPAEAVGARRQVTDAIRWKRVRDGMRRGVAKVRVDKADGVLTMLVIGKATVRRHWFLDSAKARNNRFLAVQCFDKDLRQFKYGALDATDAKVFERAVAGLLFLLGFSPSIQAEQDAPDLIVTTPQGRIVLVECTTRISDFSAKLGKLVDRRGALTKALHASGHPSTVAAALVCQLPRDQIAARADELRAHNALLFTRGDLVAAFDRLRFANDPDRMLDEALAELTTGGG